MKNYYIDTPPATISGSLHIGHIFSYTQGDIIARYQRYLGKNLIYPFCFDNNGIPTGKLASKIGIRGTQNIIDFSIEKSKDYEDIFKSSGIEFSSHQYHTYSQLSIDIAYQAFEILKSKGIAYKSDMDFLWCPKQKCSISQSELNDDGKIERSGEFPEIKKGTGWFINIKDHIPQIKEKIYQISWHPERFRQNALDWCDNIKWDWSISRERHFGIPIPGEENTTFDTWFISALTPQICYSSSIGRPTLQIPILDMRFQAHDIIRTWSFYTICMSYFLNDQIPWKDIMITGHTLDGEGNKESKSIGNATKPLPLIEKYGPSGIRYWSGSNTLGTDTRIDEDKMKMGWRITNKLDNAKRFIQLQTSNGCIGEDEGLIEIYFTYKKSIMDSFEKFDIDKASSEIYDFFWNIFCSKWIEESKYKSTSITLKWIIDDLEPIIRIITK